MPGELRHRDGERVARAILAELHGVSRITAGEDHRRRHEVREHQPLGDGVGRLGSEHAWGLLVPGLVGRRDLDGAALAVRAGHVEADAGNAIVPVHDDVDRSFQVPSALTHRVGGVAEPGRANRRTGCLELTHESAALMSTFSASGFVRADQPPCRKLSR
jgi:hypothetical protein